MLVKTLWKHCTNNKGYQTSGLDVQYKFIRDKSTVWIIFQQTAHRFDWIINFWYKARSIDYNRRTGNDIWFGHSGFTKAYESAEKNIISDLVRYINNYQMRTGKKITHICCGGWSMGAGLVQPCIEDIKRIFVDRKDSRKFPTIDAVLKPSFGFGSPRCVHQTNGINFTSQNIKIINFRQGLDIFTHLPPKLMKFIDSGTIIQVGDRPNIFKFYKLLKYHISYGDMIYNLSDTDDYK